MAKAAPKSQDLNINLLQKEEVAGTAGDLIKWTLTVGRYLIILTEIVALVTFALGIKYSADKNDLKQRVLAAKSEVDAKSSCEGKDPELFCEDRFRTLQDSINQVKSQRQKQVRQSLIIKELLFRLPTAVKLTNLTIDDKKLSFNGFFPNSVDLQTLIISFSNSSENGKIIDLDIQDLSSPSASDPNFNFKATAVVGPNTLKDSTSSASQR